MGLPIVNKLKSVVLKREDNQQGEDRIDTGEDIWKVMVMVNCVEKYITVSEKQLILSPIELEDNVLIDMFQAGSSDVTCELTPYR